MLRVLGLEVLGVLGVFTSESVGGQMSTEGEREERPGPRSGGGERSECRVRDRDRVGQEQQQPTNPSHSMLQLSKLFSIS